MDEIGIVEAPGLLGREQGRNRVGQRDGRLERAGDALVVLDPLRQVGRVQLRDPADALVQCLQHVGADDQESDQRQNDQGQGGDRDADTSQAGAQGLENGGFSSECNIVCDLA